jgi:hypothetical protein
MAYIVDTSEREETDLGNLAPSSGASLRAAVRSTFGENASTLIYDAGRLRQANAIPKQRLTVEEAQGRAEAAGVKLPIPEDSYTAEALDILIQRQKDHAALALVQERTPWSWLGSPARGTAMLLTGIVDPLNVASAFVPVVREQRAAAMIERAGASFLARTAVRARIGATEGVAGAAMLEPVVAGLHSTLADDYGMTDSLVNLAFGGILGGGLHSTVGALADFTMPRMRDGTVQDVAPVPIVPREAVAGSAADVVRAASPEVREVAMRGAVADMATGRAPEVEAVLRIGGAEREANFRAWFGASKVVDEQGAPLVVYHGTRADVQEFAPSTVGERFGRSIGYYFTSRPDSADVYARGVAGVVEGKAPEGANLVPAYVKAEKPLVLTTDAVTPEAFHDANFDAHMQAVREGGHDALIIKRQRGDEYDSTMVVAMRPEQVKSAIGNSGRFDPQSGSLTDPLQSAQQRRADRPSAVASSDDATAADQRLTAAPKDNGVEAAQAELDAATARLDDLGANLKAAGRDLTERLDAAMKPFDEAIADAKKMGDAVKALATCGTMT